MESIQTASFTAYGKGKGHQIILEHVILDCAKSFSHLLRDSLPRLSVDQPNPLAVYLPPGGSHYKVCSGSSTKVPHMAISTLDKIVKSWWSA